MNVPNALAVLGGVVGAGYVVLAEAIPRSGLFGCMPHPAHDIPWVVILVVVASVAPATLGPERTARLLRAVATRFSGQQRKPPTGGSDAAG